jgi:hypothetical protein
MSNTKVQILNLMSYRLKFGFHLTFACLREAASAKAGTLTFELFPWRTIDENTRD